MHSKFDSNLNDLTQSKNYSGTGNRRKTKQF